jgi:exopolysaccharide biosynthesis polyprenyl glycosylphosphotransferase
VSVELLGSHDSIERDQRLPLIRRIGARLQRTEDRQRGPLVRHALILSDVVAVLVAYASAEAITGFGHEPSNTLNDVTETFVLLASVPLWILLGAVYQLYDRDESWIDGSTADDLPRIFNLVTAVTWIFFLATRITGVAGPTLTKIATSWLFALITLSAGRVLTRTLLRRSPAYLQKAVIVGAGETGQLIAHKLVKHPEYGIRVVGFVDSTPRELRRSVGNIPILGNAADLPTILEKLSIGRVIIAFSRDSHDDVIAIIRQLRKLRVHVDIIPRLFEVIGARIAMNSAEGMPVLTLPRNELSASARRAKRILDFALALIGVAMIAPALALFALLIKIDSRGPVFFRQVRMGSDGQTFLIRKFRTMAIDADKRKSEIAYLNVHAAEDGDPRMFKVVDDPRTTRVGRFLRRYSLDELPQLLNVVTGEMSLVGPRPLILEEDQYVEEWARPRLALKPGMTGLWQVSGASSIPFHEMVRLDYAYVSDWSLFDDVKLLLRTVPAIIRDREAH